jgi:8-oxo-dGTP diphosphatase
MPRLNADIAIIHENQILLIKREDFDIWALPGGGVEDGESVTDAAIREAREETGLEIEPLRMVGIYSRIGSLPNIHAVLIIARPTGGTFCPLPGETTEIRYFPFNKIPENLTFGHQRRIQDAIESTASGLIVRQEINIGDGKPLKYSEMLKFRDESGLSREAAYFKLIEGAKIKEVVEICYLK